MDNNEHQDQSKHVTSKMKNFSICKSFSFRLIFVNLIVSAMICLTGQIGLGVTLFVVIHLLAVCLSLKEPDFLYLDSKLAIKTIPIQNRW